MNILLDAIPLTNLMTGISRYVRNLYGEMEGLAGARVYYYTGKALGREMPGVIDPGPWIRKTDLAWRLPDPAVLAFRTLTWLMYEHRVRRLVHNGNFQVYHETAFTPAAVKGIPQVFTLHDLSLMKLRGMHPRERVWFSDLFFHRRIRHADHIITVSEFIRSEICQELHIPPERVTAIHEAHDPFFFPREKKKVGEVLSRLGLPAGYLLCVGTLEPRKNLGLLIDALAGRDLKVPVVLVGWRGWGDDAWWERAREAGLRDRIFPTGYVDEEALACLYSGALALVFPSLYEGFGLPLLEAMACGCPVICSNAASLPEVAGDAALLIDPYDPETLSRAIDRVVRDRDLRKDLSERGLNRAARFSWKRAAEETLGVLERVGGGRG